MSFKINNKIDHTAIMDNIFEILSPDIPFIACLCSEYLYNYPNDSTEIVIKGTYVSSKEVLLGFWEDKKIPLKSGTFAINNLKITYEFQEISDYISRVVTGTDLEALEMIFSPSLIHKNVLFQEFQETVKSFYISKKIPNLYLEKINENINQIKTLDKVDISDLLNTYRLLLSSYYLLKRNDLCIDLVYLNEKTYKLELIEDLIKKHESKELYIDGIGNIETYITSMESILAKILIKMQSSPVQDNVRKQYRLKRFISGLHSEITLQKPYLFIPKRNSDNETFAKSSSSKLLLEINLFKAVEKALNTKIYPKQIVFVPELNRYFHFDKKQKPRKNINFINVDLFLSLMNKSNPYVLIALLSGDSFSELLQNKERIITKKLFNSFNEEIDRLIESLTTYISDKKTTILIFLLLYNLNSLLKKEDIVKDYSNILPLLEKIHQEKLSEQDIEEEINNLRNQSKIANEKTILKDDTVDYDLIEKVLKEIKAKQWI